MSPAFLRAFAFTCSEKIEGGYSDDKNDPGNYTGGKIGEGELLGTKFGISAKAYPLLDIKSLTREQARDIYARDYWLAAKCDQLPPRLALCHFDFAVNAGIDRANKVLQRSLGVVDDGVIGPVTIRAAKLKEQNDSCAEYLAERAMFYASLKQYDRYGKGWMRRVTRCAMEVGR